MTYNIDMSDVNPWDFVRRYAEKPERLVVGLMSGTSVDGVDAALVRISGTGRETKVNVIAFTVTPIPLVLRHSVLDVSHGKGNAETISILNVRLGHLFADAVEAVLHEAGIPATEVDAVASHGQTISHVARAAATLQIGEASIISQRIGVPLISDFRTADMAAGGQGAPLVPYADWCLLTHPTKARAIQNIGGIGNVTFLPADAAPATVLGFDTGPGNMLIDRAAQWATDGRLHFDRDGEIAAAGIVHEDLLASLLDDPFLNREPPKSAGREEFGEAFFQRFIDEIFAGVEDVGDIILVHEPDASARGSHIELLMPKTSTLSISSSDVVATLTAFTAESIVDAYRRFLPEMPDEVIVGGGGARNPTLMRMLADKLTPIPVRTHEDVGMNSDSKEAVAFALLANETLLGNPSNLPSVTGAARSVVLGKLTLP